MNPGTRFDKALSSYFNENKTYSGNPSFTYHSLWSILQTWQGTKANPGSPVLYTVAIYATFENMNFGSFGQLTKSKSLLDVK